MEHLCKNRQILFLLARSLPAQSGLNDKSLSGHDMNALNLLDQFTLVTQQFSRSVLDKRGTPRSIALHEPREDVSQLCAGELIYTYSESSVSDVK